MELTNTNEIDEFLQNMKIPTELLFQNNSDQNETQISIEDQENNRKLQNENEKLKEQLSNLRSHLHHIQINEKSKDKQLNNLKTQLEFTKQDLIEKERQFIQNNHPKSPKTKSPTSPKFKSESIKKTKSPKNSNSPQETLLPIPSPFLKKRKVLQIQFDNNPKLHLNSNKPNKSNKSPPLFSKNNPKKFKKIKKIEIEDFGSNLLFDSIDSPEEKKKKREEQKSREERKEEKKEERREEKKEERREETKEENKKERREKKKEEKKEEKSEPKFELILESNKTLKEKLLKYKQRFKEVKNSFYSKEEWKEGGKMEDFAFSIAQALKNNFNFLPTTIEKEMKESKTYEENLKLKCISLEKILKEEEEKKQQVIDKMKDQSQLLSLLEEKIKLKEGELENLRKSNEIQVSLLEETRELKNNFHKSLQLERSETEKLKSVIQQKNEEILLLSDQNCQLEKERKGISLTLLEIQNQIESFKRSISIDEKQKHLALLEERLKFSAFPNCDLDNFDESQN